MLTTLLNRRMSGHITAAGLGLALVLAGCVHPKEDRAPRARLTLHELEIAVHSVSRSFMLSDKSGGFLVGHIDPGTDGRQISWTVNGEAIPGPDRLRVGDVLLTDAHLDSAIVRPDLVKRVYRNGVVETISVLDGIERNGKGGHAILIDVQAPNESDMFLAPGFRIKPGGKNEGEVAQGVVKGHGTLTISADPAGIATDDGVRIPHTRHARFLMNLAPEESAAGALLRDADSLLARRSRRMEDLLNRTYIRTSDRSLTRALSWLKLSIDALIIDGRDTFAVAGLPWDGSTNGRDNAQSIAGMGLACGADGQVASVIHTLARWQERSASRTTYGRIADWVNKGQPSYDGADVGPWFVRGMYEYVVTWADTMLMKEMYPVVKRGLDGTLKFHVDGNNLLVHGDGETWMSTRLPGSGKLSYVPRGNRAAEVQLLWYFQQLIGSFAASYVGDTVSSELWGELSKQTAASFNRYFIDTVRNTVYDHVLPGGKGVPEGRPNALFCLEILGSGTVQQEMIKTLVNRLVYPNGVGTLDCQDPRFHALAGTDAQGKFNGPVWTWLAGQFAYALSRYDRQDFSYQVMDSMVRLLHERGMAGSLPAMMNIVPGEGAGGPDGAGAEASLTGMAEFLRSFYQDYLGLRIDVPSNVLSLQPKLPGHITDVDFTVNFGADAVTGRIEKGKNLSRIILSSSEIRRPVRVSFLWMLDNGDAWRGSTMLAPDTTLTVAFGQDDVLAYNGTRPAELINSRQLKNFSQRESFTGFEFAKPPGH